MIDLLLRRSSAGPPRPARPQTSGYGGLSMSRRGIPRRTARSGTQRARSGRRITRVSRCVARGFKALASFMSAGCCWRRSLAVDGGSGTSRGSGTRTRSAWAKFLVGQHRRTTVRFSGGSYLQVAMQRASVGRSRRSSLLAVGRCCCCHCCCQPFVDSSGLEDRWGGIHVAH